ncbi:SH3 domain-containing protein [Paradevosia shaoguanensis]|uniref:SH3 domain-containing protein n=1 Tax=Paradevosia shaoguanensis TaxID=1335043 RepID=A0AA41QQY4_9HYPH|nr:SH3 domain-containing protein [Paradevosia shaoguanensis]MCF1743533.1 SH3 domain-containing protein [Paradevosia shaoguanensis]MCI0128016.1 SH3 domain-containing protein [Paradevosia shaoguanensis]
MRTQKAKSLTLSALALLATMPFLTPARAAEPTARSTAILQVRTAPGWTAPVIGNLAKNQQVTLEHCTRNGDWCQLGPELTPDLAGGWVRAGYLVGMAAKIRVTPFQFMVNPWGRGY